MAATKRQLNWTGVTYVVGNTTTTITGVRSVDFDYGGQLAAFAGDNDRFPTTKVNTMNDPKATVRSGDVPAVMGLVPGTAGTFNATHADAKAASGGAMVYALSNAIIANATASGAHAQFGEASLMIESYSSDGSTSPLAFSRS